MMRQFMTSQMGQSEEEPSNLEAELARQEAELQQRPPEWGAARPIEPPQGSMARLRVPGAPSSLPQQQPRGPAATFVEGMMKRGWTREEAAGLAGNIQIESAFRSDVKSSVPKEQSFGLMQWNKDRLQGLKNMAAASKRDWRDPEVQMDWINMERNGDSVKFGGSNERGFYKKALGQKGTPEEYAERIGRFVERPRDLSATLRQRQQFARQYMAGEEQVTAAPSPAFDSEAQVTPTTPALPKESKTTTPTTTGAKLFQGEVYPAQGFVFHHSGGGSLKSLVDTLRQRKLGSQYLMDRDGTIYSFAGAGSPHIKPNDQFGGKAPGLSNANAVGMEIVAKDDSDITPAQVESARNFIAQNYPNTPVYGHGEVNPGHKQATEGMTVVNAIRGLQQSRNYEEQVSAVRNIDPNLLRQSVEQM